MPMLPIVLTVAIIIMHTTLKTQEIVAQANSTNIKQKPNVKRHTAIPCTYS
jgi:hypothetical protein